MNIFPKKTLPSCDETAQTRVAAIEAKIRLDLTIVNK